jgi:hypothetical protein
LSSDSDAAKPRRDIEPALVRKALKEFMSERADTPLSIALSGRQRNLILFRILQCLILSSGIISIVWAFSGSQFRDTEGFLKGTFCLPVTVGIALIILGCTVVGRWKRSAFWFVLALVGQAVALQMIDAGPFIHYQHYKIRDGLLSRNHPLLVTYLAVQTILVARGVNFRWPSVRAWIGASFKPWQLLGVGLICVLSSAALSRPFPLYIAELLFAASVQIVNLGNILLMIWTLPEEALAGLKHRFERFFGESRQSRSLDRFVIVVAIWIAALAAVLSYFVYQQHPHVPDEVIYLYHARYFADGKLTVPAPLVPEAFRLYMIPYHSANWYSIFPPGWPAILALGVLLGVPWLINPMLGAVNVLLTYILVQEIYDRRVARWSVLLLCISPWHLFMTMNFMAHTFTLTCALLAAVNVSQARKTGKPSWAFVGGLASGMISLIRPLDGLIVSGLVGLWAIGVRNERSKVPMVVALALGTLMIGSVGLAYNKLITGVSTVDPLSAYYEDYFGPKKFTLGFGHERGMGWAIDAFPGHSPLEAILNAGLNLFSLNIELFGWSTGSLLVASLFLFSGTLQRRDYLWLAPIFIISGAYSLFWYSGGPDFGPRYWYLMLVPLVVLSIRGIQFLEEALKSWSVDPTHTQTRISIAVLVLCLSTLVNYVPWRAIDKYQNYLGMRPDIRYMNREYGFGKSLVFVRGGSHPDYASAWIYNPLDPGANEPLYVWDEKPDTHTRVLEAYPTRRVWVVNGPSITNRGYEVISGPDHGDRFTSRGG